MTLIFCLEFISYVDCYNFIRSSKYHPWIEPIYVTNTIFSWPSLILLHCWHGLVWRARTLDRILIITWRARRRRSCSRASTYRKLSRLGIGIDVRMGTEDVHPYVHGHIIAILRLLESSLLCSLMFCWYVYVCLVKWKHTKFQQTSLYCVLD